MPASVHASRTRTAVRGRSGGDGLSAIGASGTTVR